MNVEEGASVPIDLEEKPTYTLFVECLRSEDNCYVSYSTAGWNSTVSIAPKESSTFPASNSAAVLEASMTPEYYNQEGPVEVVLTFTLAGSSLPVQLSLTASDLTITNGVISSEISEPKPGEFHFQVTPSARSSFAVILSPSLMTLDGFFVERGALQAVLFDDEAPYLLTTQYTDGLIEDVETKQMVLTLNEPVSVVSFSGVVQSVAARAAPNSFEVVLRGSGEALIDFADLAGNRFAFSHPVVFGALRFAFSLLDPQSDLVLLEQPALNATLPLNGRVEFAFNHAVRLSATVREAQLAAAAAGAATEADAATGAPTGAPTGTETISVRLDNQRMVRVESNRVLVFFDPAVMREGAYVLTIPAGAFESEAGKTSEAIVAPVWVAGKQCNTGYVVGGMRGEKCRCFSRGDRCQCSCGETSFSREY